MKRIVLFSVILVLLVGTTVPACSNAVVTFPDWNLGTAIRDTINKPEGPILMSDLKSLTMLKVQERGISDLTGMEHLTNLRWLALIENNISDISPLAGLTKLEMLALVENNISDISPLAGLTNLQGLFLTSNNISDISPLAGLTNLETLELTGNNISDISPLVANSGLSTGDTVNLWSNPLSTRSVNTYIPQLEQRGVNVEQTAPPTDTTLVTLPDLSLEAAIREAINKPEGPIFMSDLKSLTMLEARERGISDLTGLEYCVNLEYLELWYNNISDLSPLADLTTLDYLFLTSNNISDISPLAGLTNLDYLYLNSNNISDISPLAGLTNLDYLFLNSNNISDISPLVANSGLSEGDTVDLRDNPLSTRSANTYIPQLEERGVDIKY